MKTQTKDIERKLITRAEACKRYGFSLRSIDNLVSEGIIPVIRFSKKCVRIPLEQADAAIDSLIVGGSKK